jgi:hypothetical protein
VRGGVDADLVAGDNARVTFVSGQVVDFHTIDPLHAGNDLIVTGNGNDVVLGGEGNDTIRTGIEGAFDNGPGVQVISINFGAEAGESSVTGTAGAVQAGNWNNLLTGKVKWGNDPDFFNSLVFGDGSLATGVGITWGEDLDSWHSQAADVADHDEVDADTQNTRLFEGYLTVGHHDTLGVDITGLDAHFDVYDVYVYIDADDDASHHDSLRRISDGTSTYFLDDEDGNAFSGEFVEGGNYVVFRGVSGGSFSLRIDDASPHDHHDHVHPALNAIQIVGGEGRNALVLGGDFEDDVVLGDSGRVRIHQGVIYEVASTDLAAGNGFDADDIATGEGSDLVLGGNGPDTIDAGAGDDLVLGDNARIAFFQGRVVGLEHEDDHGWQLNDHHHHHGHDDGHGDDHDDHDHDHDHDDDDDHDWSHGHGHDHHDHHGHGHDHGFDAYDIAGIELLGTGIGGNDTIEGGADDDLMYGQFGDDTSSSPAARSATTA